MLMKFKIKHVISFKSPLNFLRWNSNEVGLVESFQLVEEVMHL